MNDPVRLHYETWVYPRYPLAASVRRSDTYALNLDALYARFNGTLPPAAARRILLAGCGSFSPYPTTVANPGVPVTALDLSAANLRRARLHAWMHGRFGICFERGDILDPAAAQGEYGFIDSFGVIHHLADPLAGLRALEWRLAPGGILRVMVYSRGARRAVESARRALRLIGVRDMAKLKTVLRRSPPGSRLSRAVEASGEEGGDAGLADALLHPRARTFTIDGLMAMVGETGLVPLRFAHHGALVEPAAEVVRLRSLERAGEPVPNFILYLGREIRGGCGLAPDALLMLNPALRHDVGMLRLAPLAIPPRLGRKNPVIGFADRRFLRRFRTPVPVKELTPEDRERAMSFLEALFLIPFR
jgi:SAM-dependent methyltransferase